MNETLDQLLKMQDLNDQSHAHTKRVLSRISKISETQQSINEEVAVNLQEIHKKLQKVLSSPNLEHSKATEVLRKKHYVPIKPLLICSGVIFGVWVGVSFELLQTIINACAS
ncbi:hypothetical protein TH4_21000 [Thalassospira tepidiphila MCCC 1A03514]|uniref:Uncharacterized protein n=1 Tax=Thalassospira tepidiphila MCCC 1A03514 TaxID=1177930 RepID=A0A853KV44_9PROT|nr:hypothetical protein TH4_21000 [Thalassospira tepidiphila MCCC 1A03514]